jgi:hypothetical protein
MERKLYIAGHYIERKANLIQNLILVVLNLNSPRQICKFRRIDALNAPRNPIY